MGWVGNEQPRPAATSASPQAACLAHHQETEPRSAIPEGRESKMSDDPYDRWLMWVATFGLIVVVAMLLFVNLHHPGR